MKLTSSPLIIAVRLRGSAGVKKSVQHTFRLLNLKKQFHATLLENNSSFLGMLEKVKDYATWGEASRETLIRLFSSQYQNARGASESKRARREKEFGDVEQIVDGLMMGKVSLEAVRKFGVKTAFNLHPAKGGFRRGLKRPFRTGGELGYRGEKINEQILGLS